METKIIKLSLIIFAIAMIMFSVSFYHSRIAVEYSLIASDLAKAYEKNEDTANHKYLGKVLEVTGIVKDFIKSNNELIILVGSGASVDVVRCTLTDENNDLIATLKKNDRITVRGVCTGMLLDVVLINCEVTNSYKQ